jgi:hypothetical protein
VFLELYKSARGESERQQLEQKKRGAKQCKTAELQTTTMRRHVFFFFIPLLLFLTCVGFKELRAILFLILFNRHRV